MAIGGKAGESFSEINVTPLTDVFLVLLVIMILIAPLVNQTALKVSPPATTRNPPDKDEKKPKIYASVLANGKVSINGNCVEPSGTREVMNAIKLVQSSHPGIELPLVLASDESALQKDVVTVMDAATGCNIKKLVILPPEQNLKK